MFAAATKVQLDTVREVENLHLDNIGKNFETKANIEAGSTYPTVRRELRTVNNKYPESASCSALASHTALNTESNSAAVAICIGW